MRSKTIRLSFNDIHDDEIKGVTLLQQMKIDLSSFDQKLNTSNNGEEEFNNYMKRAADFSDKETNRKLVDSFLPSILNSAIERITKIDFHESTINQIFSIIEKHMTNVSFLNSTFFSNFFIYLADGEEKKFNVLKENEKVLSKIFSDDSFVHDFLSNNSFSLVFKTIFLDNSSKEMCQFFHNLVFNHIKKSLLATLNLQPIISEILKHSNENVYSEVALFLTKLVGMNTQYCTYFDDSSNFIILSDLLSNAPFEVIITCFQELIFNDSPNFRIFPNIIVFYQNNSRIQSQLFKWVFQIAETKPEFINSINEILPFSSWILPQTPISELYSTISLFDRIAPQYISQFLSPLFSLLYKNEADVHTYLISVDLIENQILRHRISLTFLLDSLFLHAFIVKPSVDILGQIFMKSYTFAQLVYDIYALPKAKPIRQEVLGKIIKVAAKYPETTHIISIFVVISDSNKNIKDLMDLIENSRNGDLCNALSSAFPKSEAVTKHFLQENGIQWIDRIYREQIINIDIFLALITNLSSREPNIQVDEYIESLNEEHPLFHLDENQYRSIIYGYDDPQDFYPIKIHSLFYLLPCPWSIDPYNASIIGKYVLRKYKDKLNLPIIAEIGNRYITDQQFHEFIEKSDEYKNDLEQFTDPSYDHFPIFQVFEFNDEYVFENNFYSLSFWFKFGSSIDASLKVPFFHVSKFQLFLKNNVLLANYEGTEYEAPINPLKWNHILISISSERASHTIKIWVNLNKAIFHSPKKVSILSGFGFLVYASFLYIGPAIRVYSTEKCSEISDIYKLGPSSMQSLHETKLITPFSLFPINQNILPVHYNGFPEHFKTKRKRDFFFDQMRKSNNEVFDALLSLYLKLYNILKNDIPELFQDLLVFFTTVSDKLTKERFIGVLEFFGSQMGNKILLNEILKNKILWDIISNDIIIFSMVSYFKTFDFFDDIDKFQVFLSSRALTNPKSKYIITSLLVNASTLPKYRKCLQALFICSHFLAKRLSKETQCSLLNKTIQNDNKEKIIGDSNDLMNAEETEGNCVSIQCNLVYDEKSFQNYDDQLLLFQEIINTELQFTFTECIQEFIIQTGKIDVIKSFLPMEDLLSLFIISQKDFKASLFTIFTLIEKSSPGYIQIDQVFLSSMSELYIYPSVWDNVISLISDDRQTIKNTSMISLILVLFWGYAAASFYSTVYTGVTLPLDLKNEIQFCQKNANILSKNKTSQTFIKTWFPLLFGFAKSHKEFPSTSVRLENIEIVPPDSRHFFNYVYKKVLLAADLPLKFITEESKNSDIQQEDPTHKEKFIYFIHSSNITMLIIKVLLGSTDNNFLQLFIPFLVVPFIANKKIYSIFISEFLHTLLTNISQEYSPTLPLTYLELILHELNHFGFLKQHLSSVLSDIFLIYRVIYERDNSHFKKSCTNINTLLCDLFSSFEGQNIHSLYEVLQQHVFIFAHIVKITNRVDFYLRFFLKTSHKCYNQFDQFFNAFVENIIINPKDEILISIQNHVISTDKNLLYKWNKEINSLKSKKKIITNAKNEVFSLMMNDIIENSRLYSLVYFAARRRQLSSCESLNEHYKVIDDFQDPNNNLLYLLKSFQANQNHYQKQLLPFSYPLSIPRIFTPLLVKDDHQAIKIIEENKLYSTTVHSFTKFSKQYFFDCKLKRLNHTIPSICSLSKKNIRVIPYCSIASNSKNEPINSDVVASFVRDSLNGFWGSFKLYERRIVLKIPINSILYFYQKNNACFTFWTLKNGIFTLDNIDEYGSELINKIDYQNLSSFDFHTIIFNSKTLYNHWSETKISSSEFIIGANILNKHDYNDMRKFLFLPPKNLTIFGVTSPISETLAANLSGHLIMGQTPFSNSFENPENDSVILEFFHKSNQNLDNLMTERNLQFLQSKISFDSDILYQNIGETWPQWLILDQNSFINNLPPLTIRVSSQYPLFIIVDKGDLMIQLVHYQSKKRIFEMHSKIFGRASSIYISQNNLFFSVDFDNGITHIYRILYDKKLPFKFEFVREISFENRQQTVLNGNDLLAGTFSGKVFTIWPFYRNSNEMNHYTINFENEICFAQSDDESGTFWLCDQLNSCFVYGINGELFAQTKFDKNLSSFSVVPQPLSINKRCAICGFNDGSVSIISPELTPENELNHSNELNHRENESGKEQLVPINVKLLGKCHNSKITKIFFHPQIYYFVTLDICDRACLWTHKNSERPEIKDLENNSNCPICGQKASLFCFSCKRAICTECIEKSNLCKDCI
ncbi:hypothetical protein TRFO_35364 [Tritrichomonas foetus]|uniref:BEACH domain-containing protein n=1 Tax=Tritrichomonas foetus TaxID=1144522 RepID=A0A1J4JL22_9EUKA|nr:hypothetical protein TRFO_35364 [Tritrichomonas foetus]|eukprot:OHS98267.1 hypothetical protein TRFO_35364 [Tritrichomonas foetus]